MTLPPQPASSPSTKRGPSTWTAGTLIYTSGGLIALYAWLLWGDFAWQLKERTGPIVQVMLGKYGASDLYTALFMISGPAVISMTLGPVVGIWSDRYRSKRGRRIPFLLATTPIAGLGLMGVGLSPWIGTEVHRIMTGGGDPASLQATILIVMAVFWTIFEIATVTANTVFGGLINDVVPRELIGRFFGLFRVVSLGVGIALYTNVVGHSKTHAPEILIALSALYTVGFTMMCLKVKEGDYPAPASAPGGPGFDFTGALKSFVRCCFSSPYYLRVFLFMALAVTSFIPVNLYMVFAAGHFGLSLDQYGKYMSVVFACSLLTAYPLGCLVDRFHATRVGLGCLALYALLMAAGFFVVRGPVSFGVMLISHGVVSACYNTGVSALGQLLFPRDSFAQFAAAGVFIASLASVVLSPLVGLLLDILGRDYRYAFGFSGLLALAALLAGASMYKRFRALGGPAAYQAPPEP